MGYFYSDSTHENVHIFLHIYQIIKFKPIFCIYRTRGKFWCIPWKDSISFKEVTINNNVVAFKKISTVYYCIFKLNWWFTILFCVQGGSDGFAVLKKCPSDDIYHTGKQVIILQNYKIDQHLIWSDLHSKTEWRKE